MPIKKGPVLEMNKVCIYCWNLNMHILPWAVGYPIKCKLCKVSSERHWAQGFRPQSSSVYRQLSCDRDCPPGAFDLSKEKNEATPKQTVSPPPFIGRCHNMLLPRTETSCFLIEVISISIAFLEYIQARSMYKFATSIRTPQTSLTKSWLPILNPPSG